ncbi:beta-1,4-galactosyltransferase 5 [Mytilus galloprovincialis]|nr:beta-1,4-galactosyltransferase 5 [Mytilus galloprovincialis]
MASLINNFPFMKNGHYRPPKCTPVQKVAIIVPYRDRKDQLKVFLNNVIPKIHRQQLEFGIYLVQQVSGAAFNRGMLSNIGFVEAMSDMNYDCVVIHDVDILPEDDRNLYICTDNPIHMAVKVQQFDYQLPYEGFIGGVTTFSKAQYQEINGFSNLFFGWGGEDDDLYRRILYHDYKLIRPFEDFGICGSVLHKEALKSSDRRKYLSFSAETRRMDGLNNLTYNSLKKGKKPLFNYILVDIGQDND